MASMQNKLFLAHKEVARAALDRAEEAQADGSIKPTGGAEAHGQENGYSFSQDVLFDPTTKQLNRVREQSA